MSDLYDPLAQVLQEPRNSTQLLGYYKIGRLAKYAQFEDFNNRGTKRAPFCVSDTNRNPKRARNNVMFFDG